MWEAQIVGALAETRLLADEPTLQRSDDRRTAPLAMRTRKSWWIPARLVRKGCLRAIASSSDGRLRFAW